MAAGAYNNRGYTITFGDVAENHQAMQQIGTMADTGFEAEELRAIAGQLKETGTVAEIVELGEVLPEEYQAQDACVLIIRDGVRLFVDPDALWTELVALDHDTKALMRGRVVNKKARHNLCFSEVDQEPDYAEGKGRIVAFSRLRYLNHIRVELPMILGAKSEHLQAEANFYYDLKSCGIGYHGDAERRRVIGIRLGDAFPLVYQWFVRSHPVGPRVDLDLRHGDIYVMSSKAVGYDWRKKIVPTLRHAAGAASFLTPKSK